MRVSGIIDLPVGWVRTSVGELYEFEYGKSLTKHSRTDAGEYSVFGSNGVVGKHDSYLIEGPALIVGRKGAAGAVSYSPGNCWPIDTTYFIRDNPNLSLKFSYYLLQLLNLTKHEKSTAIPGLNRNDAYAEPVLLPPLPEQKRIVAKIEELFSELDKGIESFKTAREQLKVYRQALLKHAFEGKLTAAWREENKSKLETAEVMLKRIQTERAERYRQQVKEWEKAVKEWEKGGKQGSKPGKPSQPKQLPPLTAEELAELPELPKGWGWTRLGNCNATIFDGPFGSNLKSSDYVADGVRVIRLENIGNLNFVEGKESYISPAKYESLKDHTVSARDIIFASFITENVRVVMLPHSVTKAINKADCFCVRLFGESANKKYVEKFLSTRQVYKRLESLIHGVGRPRINTTQLKDVAIPLCSAYEQSEIVNLLEGRLSEIDNLDQTITTALQQAETLRQSILKKAFSGQLVPQDPDNEPAAKLLARIKAEKEKTTTVSKQAKSANPAKAKAPKISKTTRKKVKK